MVNLLFEILLVALSAGQATGSSNPIDDSHIWINQRVVRATGERITLESKRLVIPKPEEWVGDAQVEAVEGQSLRIRDAFQNSGYVEKKQVVLAATALSEFAQRLKLNPRDIDSLIARAAYYTWKGKHKAAISDLSAAIQIRPTAELLFERGRSRSLDGEKTQAIDDYSAALTLHPRPRDETRIRYHRASARFVTRQFAEYLDDAEFLLSKDRRSAITWCNRGDAFLALGRLQEAVADFDHATSLSQDYQSPYFGKGQVFLVKGDFGAALREFDKALKLDPTDGSSHIARAFTLISQDKWTDAIDHVGRAAFCESFEIQARKGVNRLYDARQLSVKIVQISTETIRKNGKRDSVLLVRACSRAFAREFHAALQDLNLIPQPNSDIAKEHLYFRKILKDEMERLIDIERFEKK